MKRIAIAGVVLVFTIALGAGWAGAAGDPAKGKVSFSQVCAACHGSSGKGDGPAAASLNPKPRDLSDKGYLAGLKDDYLKKLIKEGGQAAGKSPLMPPLGGALKDDDIENVISYVRSLAK
ncbi:MAG TPA: cytochrome c [Candidatus Methylomirabilis sp.]|nr:cytochrome c [Candidatus Methylomirabilis sp.]HSC72297.1 cytochrome c [Candidatus Methylomirabilis sp.]